MYSDLAQSSVSSSLFSHTCIVKTTACTSVSGEDLPPPPLSALCEDPDFGGNEDPEGLSLFCINLEFIELYGSDFCGESSLPIAEYDEIFCALQEKVGGLSDLAGGEDYTVFAPNNEAFEKLYI